MDLIGLAVRLTGGPHMGFTGKIVKACDRVVAILIAHEGKVSEVVEELDFIIPLGAWLPDEVKKPDLPQDVVPD